MCLFLDRVPVHGPSGPVVAPLGSSVVLPCYVDELILMKDLQVEWGENRLRDCGSTVSGW